jgi:enoyl-CoA hydratase/carnithine racemase
MAGRVAFEAADARGVAAVTLANPGRHNAIDLGMWHALREGFAAWSALPPGAAPRAVVVRGEGGQFASGGDIEEFADFRFDEARLRHFHDEVVAPALAALADCEIPIVAQIEGTCLGGGLEIAACCDLRIAGRGSRFGAPIARLGFPMAPRELRRLVQVFSLPLLREMLLEARLVGADDALRQGVVHEVVADEAVAARAAERAARIAALAPQAARLNKRTLNQIAAGGPSEAEIRAHYAYAPHAEHREGIAAFIEKRPPSFKDA